MGGCPDGVRGASGYCCGGGGHHATTLYTRASLGGLCDEVPRGGHHSGEAGRSILHRGCRKGSFDRNLCSCQCLGGASSKGLDPGL